MNSSSYATFQLVTLLLLPALAMLAGIALIVMGVRGRHVGDHPYCRKCGFDLFGVVERTHCPECGADVTAAKAVRIGSRVRRRGILGGGIAMTAIAAAMLVIFGTRVARTVPWIRYEPVWMLVRQGDLAALKELNLRLSAGALSDRQIDSVVDAALKVQGNAAGAWLPDWGNFIDTAQTMRKVDDERWKKYAVQSTPLTLEARSRVRRGDPMPLRVKYGPVRVGYRPHLVQAMFMAAASLGGLPLEGFDPRSNATRQSLSPSGGTAFERKTAISRGQLANLPDGPNQLAIEVLVTYAEVRQPGGNEVRKLCEQRVPLTAMVRLVPADQSTVERVADESLRAAVEKVVRVVGFTDDDLSFRSWGGGGPPFIRMSKDQGARFEIEAMQPPIALAFDVALRDPSGREWPLYWMTFAAKSKLGYLVSHGWDGFDADKADVILRPSVEAAAETVDILRMWDGQIVFKDVPVKWDEGAARPSRMPDWQREYEQRKRRPKRAAATTTASTQPTTRTATVKPTTAKAGA